MYVTVVRDQRTKAGQLPLKVPCPLSQLLVFFILPPEEFYGLRERLFRQFSEIIEGLQLFLVYIDLVFFCDKMNVVRVGLGLFNDVISVAVFESKVTFEDAMPGKSDVV